MRVRTFTPLNWTQTPKVCSSCSALLLSSRNSHVTDPVAVYAAGLHLQPLLPLLQIGRAPDVAFMQSYTKAIYFVSECLLLGWLLSNGVIRSVPDSTLISESCILRYAASGPSSCTAKLHGHAL